MDERGNATPGDQMDNPDGRKRAKEIIQKKKQLQNELQGKSMSLFDHTKWHILIHKQLL